jgi:aminoglycoside phosphotransferase (APT) family kinase protein
MSSPQSSDPVSLVDRGRLRTFLIEGLSFDCDELEVSLLSGGRSNLTFLVIADDRRLVLRRPPLGVTAPGAHDMAREYRVLSALQATGLPIPRVHGYSDDLLIAGAAFYVMDQVKGLIIERRDDVVDRDARWGRACSLAVVEALVAVQAIDAVSVGLERFGRPSFLARRLTRWSSNGTAGPIEIPVR